jgi:hypothetical protein
MKHINLKIGLFHFLVAGITIPLVVRVLIINPSLLISVVGLPDYVLVFVVEYLMTSFFLVLGVFISIKILQKYYELENSAEILKISTIPYVLSRGIVDFPAILISFGFGGGLFDVFKLFFESLNFYNVTHFIVFSLIFYLATRYFLLAK